MVPYIRIGLVVLLTSLSAATNAQTLESLVEPGPVIEGHAEFEEECSNCHKRFDRDAQRVLCLDCHEDVAEDVVSGAGFHGLSPDVGEVQCSTCHTDHEGRSFEIVVLDEETFDHQFTNFELLGKHADASCESCHLPDIKRRDAPNDCAGCHLEDDVHDGFLGTECESCHVPADWLEIEFDHDTTEFPLIGKHRDVICSDCHADTTHQNTPTTCFGCHEDDDVHNGRSGEQCENCHNPVSWQDTSFDHDRDTNFPLLGRHMQASCDSCHSADPFADQLDGACVSCHLEDDSHDGHNGTDCETCHVSDDWDKLVFDHSRDTDFAIRGGHKVVACNDCHVEPIFEESPGSQCVDCHLEDDPHEQTLGTDCQNCHIEDRWDQVINFDHDLTQFPLLGEHDNLECDSCHESSRFADAEPACNSCHSDSDPHDGVFPNSCESCHNPVAWDLWIFDHNLQTEFELRGAHTDVACEDCHRASLEVMSRNRRSCGNCHRADDIHDGEFGADCGRCHSDRSFDDVRSIQ